MLRLRNLKTLLYVKEVNDETLEVTTTDKKENALEFTNHLEIEVYQYMNELDNYTIVN